MITVSPDTSACTQTLNVHCTTWFHVMPEQKQEANNALQSSIFKFQNSD